MQLIQVKRKSLQSKQRLRLKKKRSFVFHERQMEEMKSTMLAKILSPEARERINRIKLVKPEKVTGIEGSLIQMAQKGMIQVPVTEQTVIEMLEQMNSKGGNDSEIKFKRVGGGIDDEF